MELLGNRNCRNGSGKAAGFEPVPHKKAPNASLPVGAGSGGRGELHEIRTRVRHGFNGLPRRRGLAAIRAGYSLGGMAALAPVPTF